tara:strand:+ start:619 stop:1077 length:459 start_codon:yes stop_codon:yes gene_type:complete
MKNIRVRPIKEDDYKLINKWWEGIGKKPPPRKLLPENGLHGLMACKDDTPIACTYLYLTNSKMGYCDYMIGDPEYREKDRYYIIFQLMNMAIGTAKNLGYEDFWFITKSKGLLKKCRELGVKVSKDKYHLVIPLHTTSSTHSAGTDSLDNEI